MCATKYRLLLVASCALILAACASIDINLPSITESETGEDIQGKVVWHDLLTNDPAASKRFYGELFAWEFESIGHAAGLDAASASDEQAPANYRLLKQGDTPRAGILANPFEELDPVWISYLRVESPAAITARVEALGGRVLIEAQPRDLGGEVAFIAGPSEAGIAL